MQIAIISDIHGNYLALDAVLEPLRPTPVAAIVCLGDAIQGGPQPAQVAARLRALACPVVMGNADAWLLSGVQTGHENIATERLEKMGAIRSWTLAQLAAPDRGFIEGFQPTVELPLAEQRALLCFHGSPRSFDDIILPTTPETEFQRLLGMHAGRVLTGGHTHLQQIRRLGDAFFFNPGSVGFAYRPDQAADVFRADPWAEYAVVNADGGGLSLEFRRVPLDVGALIDVYRSSGRPFAAEAAAQYRPV